MSQKSLLLSLAILVVTGILIGFPRGWSQDKQKPPEKIATEKASPHRVPLPHSDRVRKYIELLNEQVAVEPLRKAKTLKEGLDLLSHVDGKVVLPILVDRGAFAQENPEAPNPDDANMRELYHKAPTSRVRLLREILSQFCTQNASFLVRQDGILVTTMNNTHPHHLLNSTFVATFQKCPLRDALQHLSEDVGISINIDSRIENKLDFPVSATFQNDVPLNKALEILADMAALKCLFLLEPGGPRDTAVYITTPEHAREWRREWNEEAAQWQRIMNCANRLMNLALPSDGQPGGAGSGVPSSSAGPQPQIQKAPPQIGPGI